MAPARPEIVAWVGRNIVPHEAALRSWLRRTGLPDGEIDDTVQDAYVRIAQLNSFNHIRNARAYFFSAARSAMLQRVRRERIVRIEALTEIDAMSLVDEAPGPEREVSMRLELERIKSLIAALPDGCREVFQLRRVEGVPQREIAIRLNMPEHSVEQQAMRGLKLLLKAVAEGDDLLGNTSFTTREREEGLTKGGQDEG